MQTRKMTLLCAILFVANTLSAQTLFHFGNNPVEKDEFLRVYKKNTINQEPDYSRKALREYLDLYSLFRMKVKEAEKQRIDTMLSIQNELSNYRKQLAQNYMTDEEVNRQLIKEAYDRMKENVKVAHIMILSSPMAPSKDTVEPYRKIDSIYTALTKGKADFAAMAAKYSEDKSTKDNGGEVGYITAFNTVYEFEDMAYKTPVGKVSRPFRTPYGYHIIKVLDRKPSPGQVQVAQILVVAQKSDSEEKQAEAKKKAEQVAKELKQGAKFEDMVKKYSEDRYTVDDNGLMQPFGLGKMVPEFEKAAFALKKPGDISEPIKTDYGYHIIKLVNKIPVKPFDSVAGELKARIERDARSEIARDIYFNKIKEKNRFKEYQENIDALREKFAKAIADTGAKANMFEPDNIKTSGKTLFEIKGVQYKEHDFLTYAEKVTRGRIMGPKDVVFRNIYDNYARTVLTDVEEQNLIEEIPDFRNLMNEYRDGIMLFELMDRNVWTKASKDTVGLKEFYSTRKNNYKWDAGFRGSVYTFKNENAMKEGMKLIGKKDMTDEQIMKKLNSEATPDAVSIQRGYYEFSKFKEFNKAQITKGKATEAKKNENGSYTVVYAIDVYDQPTPKTLDEARGYVIAEYQDYLEKKWNEELRQKYPVKVNEEVFDSMVKK